MDSLTQTRKAPLPLIRISRIVAPVKVILESRWKVAGLDIVRVLSAHDKWTLCHRTYRIFNDFFKFLKKKKLLTFCKEQRFKEQSRCDVLQDDEICAKKTLGRHLNVQAVNLSALNVSDR